MNQIFLETRMFSLLDGEEIVTLAFFVLIQYRSVTDGQTDGQTDIPPLAIPAVCIACYANGLVKTVKHLAQVIFSLRFAVICFNRTLISRNLW